MTTSTSSACSSAISGQPAETARGTRGRPSGREDMPLNGPATEQDLYARLGQIGVAYATHRHAAVFTVAEAKRLRGELPGGHVKNLFLKDKKGALWLLVALEDRAIDLKVLRARLGSAPLSFASAALLREVLGVEPGSVTPLALINDRHLRVTPVLDAELLRFDLLNVHPLVNTATTALSPEGLLAFLRSCGHEPRLLQL